jgi:hypothetical protein
VRPTALIVRGSLAALWIALAPAAHAAGTACSADDGIGGTGVSGPDDGVGGTGIGDARGGDEGGVGGTGVVGIITGFGSVCVNGLEIAYDAGTTVDMDGAVASTSDLALGQLAVVTAVAGASGLRAAHVGVWTAVSGPNAEFDAARGELRVLNQRVRVGPETILQDRASGMGLRPSDLARGQFVAVSGLRRADGAVQATRIERTPPTERVSVSGPLRTGAGDQLYVSDLRIVPAAGAPAGAFVGRVARAVGRWDPEARELEGASLSASLELPPDADRVSVEGYVERVGTRSFRTDLVEVDVSRISGGMRAIRPDDRVVVSGRVTGPGRLQAERVRIDERPDPARLDGTQRESDARVRAHGTDEEGGEDAGGRSESREGEPAKQTRDHREAEPRSEHVERVEAPERLETPERVEPPERPETPERPEPVERPEAPERPERIERPEVPEPPERVERPELPEPPEKPEPPERP